jgi:hypothetical protein
MIGSISVELKMINGYNHLECLTEDSLSKLVRDAFAMYNSVTNQDCLIQVKNQYSRDMTTMREMHVEELNKLRCQLESDMLVKLNQAKLDAETTSSKLESELVFLKTLNEQRSQDLKYAVETTVNHEREAAAKRESELRASIKDNIDKNDSTINDKIEIAVIKSSKDYIQKINDLNNELAKLHVNEQSIQARIDLAVELATSEFRHIAELNKFKLRQTEDNLAKAQQAISQNSSIEDTLQSMLGKFFRGSNSELGEAGEDFVYETLREITSLDDNAIVTRVNGMSNSCDIYMLFGQLKLAVEVKNHSHLIKASSVDRFINIDMKNDKYNAGIFVSLKTDFVATSKIKNFDIKYVMDKPVIFISKCLMNKDYLKIAIRILTHIIKCGRNNSEIKVIIDKVKASLGRLETIINSNNQIIKIAKTNNLIIDEIKEELNESIKFDNNQEVTATAPPAKPKAKYSCDKCSDSFNRKVDMNKHNRVCSQA